ncbi:ATP-binding protein [Bacillus salitolerans]|uniref:histidine kinase n=1 Tax=Bacillus salitolerans TaxID=1437434 RepID=A0ABW4LM62_9BACI
MILVDYLLNLSIFSLMVSTPLVIQSFFYRWPLKFYRLWVSLYAGIVSVILITFTIQHDGYSYDIRFAPVILVFSYLGPIPGLITGGFAIIARLFSSGNWMPAIVGWVTLMISFSLMSHYLKRYTPLKKSIILLVSYIFIYVITVPMIFNILRDNFMFHFQYLLFLSLGVMVGGLLIESYLKLYRIIKKNKLMEQAIASSESKYQLIAENTSDLIVVMDPSHSISYYSPSHEQVLGYDDSELEKIKLCSMIHKDDLELFKGSIERMFVNKELGSMEYRLKHKEGHYLEVESRCMPVRGKEQEIEHIVIISRDISERKRADEILLQSEKLSIVGELAAGVAHEIRNPLTTIKGFIQLYKLENSSIPYNDLLLSELDRIESITSELLSLGKPQAMQLNEVNLVHLIENTLELLSPQAHLNNIQFDFQYPSKVYCMTGEKNQLKQVFLNILKNAIEAMPTGGRIQILLRKDGKNQGIISFQDEGTGIPEEILPKLGEPFYSLKEKGTGLGLMICHKLIKQHGGHIIFYSKLGKGTKVEITVPLTS